MVPGKHPLSSSPQDSCDPGQGELAGGRKEGAIAASGGEDNWSQEGKEVGGEAQAEGHNLIMNSFLFWADCPQICH